MNPPPSHLRMEIVTDPVVVEQALRARELFDQNLAWFGQHAQHYYDNCRGKFLCIAGRQVFVADTVEEARAQAKAAHPDDAGWFTHYIPVERAVRIYAHQRTVVSL